MATSLTSSDLAANGVMDSDAPDTTSSARGTSSPTNVVAEVNGKYTKWRNDRRPHEPVWALNAALIRGLSNLKWNPLTNVLDFGKDEPAHRSRESLNRIQTKVKARLSKFLKTRPIPLVTPASTDHEDILNAAATQKVLEYQWRRLRLMDLYEEALLWAMQTGKSFWWFRWNDQAVAQMKAPLDPMALKDQIHDVPLGDAQVDFGTAFEVLVADPGITRIQKQPEIMRVRVMDTAEVEARFGLPKDSLKSELKESELFTYQRQIASLGARAVTGLSADRAYKGDEQEPFTHTVMKELFTAPCARFPKGRYLVVAGDQELHNKQELPFGLHNTESPYPVVEFSDSMSAGQFWPPTLVEQLAPVQMRYNRLHNQADEQSKVAAFPKTFYPKQIQMPKGAWNSEAGEKIPITWQPGMPPPSQWTISTPGVSADTWRLIELMKQEMDEISNLPPSSLGMAGATSGFDTNLLQEAADSVHAPDILRNERSLQEAAFKIRRLCKLGYDVPRLISIMGRENTPEAFEFSQENIDEHADIMIEAGSALPTLKHQRIEAILKLDERGLFGQANDPTRNRRVLKMLDLGSQEQTATQLLRDEHHARLENLAFSRNQPVEDPMPWEDHDVEYEIHTDLLKSPEIRNWPPEQRAGLVKHTILHVKWKNPQAAMQLAAVFGLQEVIAEIQQTMALQAQYAAPPAAPAPAGQPGAAPQPEAAPAAPAAPAPQVA